MRSRVAIGLVGLAMMAFGAVQLLGTGRPSWSDAVGWLAGSVIVHDAFIAPLTILSTVALRRLVVPRHRTRVTLGLVVLLTVTATAVPVLGGFGRRPDNPTVLPRDYLTGWLLFAGLVVAGVVGDALWSRRRGRPQSR